MDTETIELTTDDGPMPVYVARPPASEEPTRAVIVVQEAFGVDDHVEDLAGRFAAAGYLAVAPHFFHRTGGGTIAHDDSDGMLRHLNALTDDGTLHDVDVTMEWLQGQGVTDDATGLVGFCFGGRVSFVVATRRKLGAAVGFYGGGIVHGRSESRPPLLPGVPDMPTPWLGIFGGQDSSIPADEVSQIEEALARAPVATDVVVYPDAGHAFLNDTRPSGYAPDAAEGAWRRTLEWLERHLARSS